MGWFLNLLWGPEPEFKAGEALPFLRHRGGKIGQPALPPQPQYVLVGARLPWVNEHKMAARRPAPPPPTSRG
jgi:hypothetical protein